MKKLKKATAVADVDVAEVVAVVKNKTLGMRIAVISVIILIIAGIFIFKTVKEKDEATRNTSSQSQDGGSNSYPLKITKTDLEKIKAYGIPTVIDFGSDRNNFV